MAEEAVAAMVVAAVLTQHPQAVAVATRRRRAAADADTPHPQAEATVEAVVAERTSN